jgi:hypothetical protein
MITPHAGGVYNIQTRDDNYNNGLTQGKQNPVSTVHKNPKSTISFGRVDDDRNRCVKKNFTKFKKI